MSKRKRHISEKQKKWKIREEKNVNYIYKKRCPGSWKRRKKTGKRERKVLEALKDQLGKGNT